MQSIFELAIKYYKQNLWHKNQIDALLKGGKITQDEYDKIIDKNDDINT